MSCSSHVAPLILARYVHSRRAALASSSVVRRLHFFGSKMGRFPIPIIPFFKSWVLVRLKHSVYR